MKIELLLVEDNIDDANLTMRALKKHQFAKNIHHVNDGEEALDFIYSKGIYADRNLQDKPKLILLDLKMPKVNGLDVLRKLKSDIHTQYIPIVVLTSSREDPDIKACYELGVNSYIVKPVAFESFSKTVCDLGGYWVLLNEVPH